MGNVFNAHLFGRSKRGDREEVKVKFFNADGSPADLGGGGDSGPATDSGAMHFRADWVSGEDYKANDVVFEGGGVHIAVQDIDNSTTTPTEVGFPFWIPFPSSSSDNGGTDEPVVTFRGIPISHALVGDTFDEMTMDGLRALDRYGIQNGQMDKSPAEVRAYADANSSAQFGHVLGDGAAASCFYIDILTPGTLTATFQPDPTGGQTSTGDTWGAIYGEAYENRIGMTEDIDDDGAGAGHPQLSCAVTPGRYFILFTTYAFDPDTTVANAVGHFQMNVALTAGATADE